MLASTAILRVPCPSPNQTGNHQRHTHWREAFNIVTANSSWLYIHRRPTNSLPPPAENKEQHDADGYCLNLEAAKLRATLDFQFCAAFEWYSVWLQWQLFLASPWSWVQGWLSAVSSHFRSYLSFHHCSQPSPFSDHYCNNQFLSPRI